MKGDSLLAGTGVDLEDGAGGGVKADGGLHPLVGEEPALKCLERTELRYREAATSDAAAAVEEPDVGRAGDDIDDALAELFLLLLLIPLGELRCALGDLRIQIDRFASQVVR